MEIEEKEKAEKKKRGTKTPAVINECPLSAFVCFFTFKIRHVSFGEFRRRFETGMKINGGVQIQVKKHKPV